jgi:FlaA1/EpsC-like NDP-sugar epimerase
VLGSSGSVIPIFRQQIEAGGPVTVTHPDIERFFMTITEAAQLVLQAGSMGKGGEVFVLDMGKPVKILHLAEKLISLYGKRPHVDLAIDYTGLRPGEKMYEELFNVEERLIKTKHPRIMAADAMLINPAFMQQKIRDISQVIQQGDEKVLEVIFELLVPGYQSQSVNAGHESIKVGFSEEAMPESAFQKAAEA